MAISPNVHSGESRYFLRRPLLRLACVALAIAETHGGEDSTHHLREPAEAQQVHASAPARKLANNCTLQNCFNAENICGNYTGKCMAVGRMQNGPAIWMKASFGHTDGPSYTYTRKENAAFSQKACEDEDFWLEIRYQGTWREQGPSSTTLGSNIAETEIKLSWITLLKDEVCLEAEEHQTPWNVSPKTCLNIVAGMTALCPCNGWDWSRKGAATERSVGMFCSPAAQCPLFHDVYLHETHFFSYNATARSACISKASAQRERGWEHPRDVGCFDKQAAATCMYGFSAGARRASAVPLGQWLPALWLAAALASISSWNGSGLGSLRRT